MHKGLTAAICTLMAACHPQLIQDTSITFPRGADEISIDSDMLYAIRLVTDDFVRPHWSILESDVDRCIHSTRALDYYLTVTPEIIYVRVQVNPAHCGVLRGILDAGARYAVRRPNGMIVRRLFDGELDPSDESALPPPTTPRIPPSPIPTPTNLVVTGVTPNSVSLVWTAVPGVAGYNVYRSATSGGVQTQVNGQLITDSHFSDTSLSSGMTYYYIVKSESINRAESPGSNEVSATTANAAPETLSPMKSGR